MSDQPQAYRVSWDDELGVARVTWAPGAVCSGQQARETTDLLRAMGRGAVPLLVDMRGMASLERAARDHYGAEQGGMSAIALLAGSAVNRMLANFFIGLKKPAIPVKMFTDEATAVTWLRESSP